MRRLFKKILLLELSLFTSFASGAGMAVPFYATDSASTANANAAEGEAPSALVGNPAGLIYLDGTQLENNLFVFQPKFIYEQAKAFSFNTHEKIPGSNFGDIGHRLEVPGLFFSHRFSGNKVLGLGLYVPYGADFDYPMDSVMRYNGNRVKIIAAMLNPVFAFKISERHSVGVGVYLLYSMSKLRQFADLTYGANTYLDRIFPFVVRGRHVVPASTFEAYANIRGDLWKYGFNVGWLWDVNDAFRVGLSFRSKSTAHFKGDVIWNTYGSAWGIPIAGPVVEHLFRKLGYPEREKVTYTFCYPELWQLHGMWRVNPKLNLFGNITYSRDARQYALHVNWNHPRMAPDALHHTSPELKAGDFSEIVLNFRNAWSVALGGAYQYSEPLQLRFGVMRAQSSVRSPKYRLPISPDEDRTMLGLGLNYQYNKKLTLGVSYNFIKLKTAKIDTGGYCGGNSELGPKAINCVESRAHAQAIVKSKGHTLGVSFKYKF